MPVFNDLKHNSFFTVLKTWMHGEQVGKDQYGNRYFRRKRGAGRWRDEERWVLFAALDEPTEVPPGWVGWLHRRFELPPGEQALPGHKWEKERLPIMTGTEHAYRPHGAIQRGGQRAPATGDYEAWTP